jgi:hypothetical protein
MQISPQQRVRPRPSRRIRNLDPPEMRMLRAAKDLHQTVNLASDGGSGRFKILFHTQTCKECHNHTGKVVHRQFRFFRLDILGNELL